MNNKKPTFESLARAVLWRWLPAVSRVAIVGAVLATAAPALADPSTLLTDRLFGPECGIRVEPVYHGEVFTNTRGGFP